VQAELRAGMTPANRAELRGESEREGRKGARVPSSPSREASKGRKGGWERERERKERDERGGREACACLGAKSWASRAQAWPRLTLRSSRSEVILEHEPPSGSQPSTSQESPARINRIINDCSRAPRDAFSTRRHEIRDARHWRVRRNARRVIRTSTSENRSSNCKIVKADFTNCLRFF